MLLFAAIATRVWQVRAQYGVVFDEYYFRKFAGDYLVGQFFFDIHPPFVKLLFAGVAWLFGVSNGVLNAPNFEATIVRFVPALAGAFLVVVVYGILLRLGVGRKVATFGALLVLCDNALLVESRFMLMDSILLLSGFTALFCYLGARRTVGRRHWVWLVLTAVASGIAISTKWTGLATVGLITLLWLFDNREILIRQWRRVRTEMLVVGSVILAIYGGCFALHFALLTRGGGGDDAYMTSQFQSTLKENVHYDPHAQMSFIQKFLELNIRMYTAQDSLRGVRDASMSAWYTWPVQAHPIAYWHAPASDGVHQVRIYLLGNPLVWWGTTALLLTTLVLIALRRSPFTLRDRRILLFLLMGYYVNYVPFIFIQRGMYLYHYLFALLFAIMIASITLGRLGGWMTPKNSLRTFHTRRSQIGYYGILAGVVGLFVFFAPVSYGWPISQPAVEARQWLPEWRP